MNCWTRWAAHYIAATNYAYVGNNPIGYTDRLGLQSEEPPADETSEEQWAKNPGLGPDMGGTLPETQAEKESRWQTCPRANSFPPNPDNFKHILREGTGHLVDTPANRDLLLSTENNLDYLRGPDAYGNSVYTQTQSDGSQIWVLTKGGVIQNGGVNSQPRIYISLVGLRHGR